MNFCYPAVFRKQSDGTYKGIFPDLEGCYGEGETLDDAINQAIEAEREWIRIELTEFDGDLPFVSHHEDLALEEGDIVRDIEAIVRITDGFDE